MSGIEAGRVQKRSFKCNCQVSNAFYSRCSSKLKQWHNFYTQEKTNH